MTEQTQITERTTYKFERVTTYSDGTSYTDVKIFTEDADDGTYSLFWPNVANAFLCWLGSVYHYDIRGQVKLPPYHEELVKKLDEQYEEKGVSYDEI